MKLEKSEAQQAARDRERLELDLSQVPDFSVHIPGHARWKWFLPLFLILCTALLLWTLYLGMQP